MNTRQSLVIHIFRPQRRTVLKRHAVSGGIGQRQAMTRCGFGRGDGTAVSQIQRTAPAHHIEAGLRDIGWQGTAQDSVDFKQ